MRKKDVALLFHFLAGGVSFLVLLYVLLSFIFYTAYIFLTRISSDEVFEGHHFNLGSSVLRIHK